LSGGRRRTPGRIDWRRIALALVAFVAIVTVSTTITAAALVWYGEQQIAKVDVETQVPGDVDGDGSVDIAEMKDVRNVLVVGSDSRKDLSAAERRELGTGQFSGTRTDTIMVVQLDPNRQGAAMLSFPRDLLVTRCDGSEGRINSAFEIGKSNGVGGPTCLVRTITELTGIPIHHYAQINFQGFVDVVDTLGGVKMYLEEPIQDDDANVDLPAGCVTLRGADALGFVRVRKIDSDFGRIARQQRFIREVVDQVTSASVALNIPRLFSLVEAGASAVETDPSLSLSVMRQIAFSFRDLSSDRIDTRTVPGFNRTISGASYVVTDPEPAEELFEAFREGVAAPEDVGTRGPKNVGIGDVPPVRVLNATTTGGLAASVADLLAERGLETAGTGNATARLPRTRIIHPPGLREEAVVLRRLFPGATLVPNAEAEASQMVVELGADVDPEALAAALEQESEPTGAPEPEPTPTYAGASASERRNC
jgi:LCP family protein required for cell wall assembly